LLFKNAFSNNPKCAPARSSLLPGRYSWQLEEAVVHRSLMPEKWRFYPDNDFIRGDTLDYSLEV